MSKSLRLAGGSGLVAALAIILAGILATGGASNTSAQGEPPSRFAGSVIVNGAPAAAGTVVEARIGGNSCGTALVFISGAEARYALDVVGAGQQAGCGTSGASIVFLVGGVAANQTGTWNNPELQIVNLTVTTATATPTTPAGTATPTTAAATATNTPGAPKTGAGMSGTSGGSGAWMLIALGLAAVALGTGGVVATRRIR